jgi:hypothetical protein
MAPQSRSTAGVRLRGVPAALLTRVRPVLRVGPHLGAHRVALRAGVSVLVPLLAAVLAGHVGWTIYAAFGAFTSLYGRGHGYAGRWPALAAARDQVARSWRHCW